MVSKSRALILFVSAAAMLSGSHALSVNSDTLDPSSFETKQESHLFHNVDVTGISADGQTDMVYYSYDGDTLLDPKNLTTNLTVSRKMKLIDRNGNAVKETISFGVNPDGNGRKTGKITIDTEVKFRAVEDVNVSVEIKDSKYGKASDKAVLVFEGNTRAIKHRRRNHSHEFNFSDSVSKCPDEYICPKIPNLLHHLRELLNLLN